MRDIWDEGRVVGLSAYEQYVKQFLEITPDGVPATEREWLASSLATGTSLILKVPSGQGTSILNTSHYYLDIALPADSKLRAGNTIWAAFFDGEGEFADNEYVFPKAVSSYSTLIANTISQHPSGSVSNPSSLSVDTAGAASWATNRDARLCNYAKIVDGVMLQAGTWTVTNPAAPISDFTPDLSVAPVLRLELSDLITSGSEPYILLTGLTLSTVLPGISGMDTSIGTDDPDDGDFLGPAVYPWSAKIIFTVDGQYADLLRGNYVRAIYPATIASATEAIQAQSVIDMTGPRGNPATYYDNHLDMQGACIATSVSKLRSVYNNLMAVLTLHSKSNDYPSALFGTYLDPADNLHRYLYPIDIVAPGSVKMFNSSGDDTTDLATITAYETTYPGTFALIRRSDGSISTRDSNGTLIIIGGGGGSSISIIENQVITSDDIVISENNVSVPN